MVMTARATAKAARAATVAGAMKTTVTVTTAAMAATMTQNGNKDNKDGICRRQHLQGHYSQEQECRETRPAADQSRWQVTHVFPRLLGWVQISQAQSVSGKTEGMVDGCAGGGDVELRITGVQKTNKEKAKILPVDRDDTWWGGQYKIGGTKDEKSVACGHGLKTQRHKIMSF